MNLRSLTVCLFLLSGCGYQLQGSGTILPDDVRKIAIASVEDQSTEIGLGKQVEEALITQFERFGVVEVVDAQSGADAVLTAVVKDLDTRVRNVQGSNDVSVDEELILTISAELRKKNGQILWRDSNIKISEAYAGVGNVVVTSGSQFAQGGINSSTLGSLSTNEIARGQREQTLSDLVDESARRIYNASVAADF